MVPNYDEKTGIHYGVINANSLDPEALDQIITRGTSAYEASPISFDIEGVVGEYLRNSNVVMIFKSPVYTCARQCSPCYPNAGDLDTLDEYGFDTYAPPEDWWYEYNEKTAESVKTLKCVNQKCG